MTILEISLGVLAVIGWVGFAITRHRARDSAGKPTTPTKLHLGVRYTRITDTPDNVFLVYAEGDDRTPLIVYKTIGYSQLPKKFILIKGPSGMFYKDAASE